MCDDSFPWLAYAGSLIGIKELPGQASNPVLLKWAADLGLPYRQDSTPWCGLFVAHVLARSLPLLKLPKSPLWARSWARFGVDCEPKLGSILVFTRGPVSGHVGFYLGEDAYNFKVLGGNQNDSVCVKNYAKSRLLASRWPILPDQVAAPLPQST